MCLRRSLACVLRSDQVRVVLRVVCCALRYVANFCSSFVFSFFSGLTVRREVGTDVRLYAFTVAILAQGTNRGDALCAALLSNRVVSNRGESIFFVFSCSSLFFFVFVFVTFS